MVSLRSPQYDAFSFSAPSKRRGRDASVSAQYQVWLMDASAVVVLKRKWVAT
jgi:hypothetical protein